MQSDVLFHIEQTLSPAQQSELAQRLAERLGSPATFRESARAHLKFFACDPELAPPHRVLAELRAAGLNAQLVDL